MTRAFRTSESESADFSEVRVRKFRTLKTLRTRTQRVCLFTHLYCKEVNISQKKSEISIFSFLKSYYSLYKPHAQISTIVKNTFSMSTGSAISQNRPIRARALSCRPIRSQNPTACNLQSLLNKKQLKKKCLLYEF
jgi:hypothetical protein